MSFLIWVIYVCMLYLHVATYVLTNAFCLKVELKASISGCAKSMKLE